MRKIICLVLSLFLFGCASTMQSHLNTIQNNFSNANFTPTTKQIATEQNNLELLINGMALFHDNKFAQSDSLFEEFNKRNLNETSSSITREAAGLLLGQGVNSYKPYMMDSLFVSYYQIWDLLALQDWANARVVINQSYTRQQNMSIEYKKLIEENKNKIASDSQYYDIIDKKYDLFLDIHSNRGSNGPGDYRITNFVFAPGFDERSSGFMNEIIDSMDEIVYYAPEFRSSPPYITEPTAKAGIPTLVYECYSFEKFEYTCSLASKLVDVVDSLHF